MEVIMIFRSKKQFKRWLKGLERKPRGRWQQLFSQYGFYHPLWFWEV